MAENGISSSQEVFGSSNSMNSSSQGGNAQQARSNLRKQYLSPRERDEERAHEGRRRVSFDNRVMQTEVPGNSDETGYYEQSVEDGSIVLSVPVTSSSSREDILRSASVLTVESDDQHMSFKRVANGTGSLEMYKSQSKSHELVNDLSEEVQVSLNESESQYEENEDDDPKSGGTKIVALKEAAEDEPMTAVGGVPPNIDQYGSREKLYGKTGDSTPADSNSIHQSILSATSSMNSRLRNAPEMQEIFSSKFYATWKCWLALVINIVLLVLFSQLRQGVTMPIPTSIVRTIGTVAVEILLLGANMFTISVTDNGLAAYFGRKLTEKHGYSLAISGFYHAHPFEKTSFCNQLSLGSSCRKLLSRIAYGYMLLEFLKLLTPLSAIALTKAQGSRIQGTVSCIEFNEIGEIIDRGWPSLNSSGGFAELIFGTALGYMRSEFPLEKTTMIMTPQMVGAVADGDTLTGRGLITDITSKCQCLNELDADSFNAIIPEVTPNVANAMLGELPKLSKFGIVSYIDEKPDVVNAYMLIAHSKLCGGTKKVLVPACITKFYNHQYAGISSRYMTDGTPASIAQEAVTHDAPTGPANLTWVASSLRHIFEGTLSHHLLYSQIPGIMNPLFWWTTPNLLTTDPAFLDAGLETLYSILLRAGMQRTLHVKGESCPRIVPVNDSTLVAMSGYGVDVAIFILSMHIVAVIAALLAHIPWFLSTDCIGPGMRAVQSKVYMTALVTCTRIPLNSEEMCNAPTFQIWQNLDVIVRIGEALDTIDEDVGHILMDKPKMVRPLVNGRRYM